MSISTRKILNLIAMDYALYNQKRKLKNPSEKDKQEIYETYKKAIPNTEIAEIYARGHSVEMRDENRSKLRAHSAKLAEAGIEKTKIKNEQDSITLSYRFNNTSAAREFFKPPRITNDSNPSGKFTSVSVAEDENKIEVKINFRLRNNSSE